VSRCRHTCGASANRGSALVIVLWVTLGLVTIAVYFGHAMVLEYRAAANSAGEIQAQHAVEGARRYLIFMLDELETPGELPDVSDYENENVAVGKSRFWVVGRQDDLLLEADDPAFGLVDEASKLNLNTATLEMLEALPYMTAELAAAIVDWRDPDTEITANGAESETYLLLEPPYNAKDSSFETLEELRLVYGADLELLYGEDTNRNGVLDANEDDGDNSYPDDDANGELRRGLLEYLTVFSREPNTQKDGSPRVNLREQGDQQEGANGQTLAELLAETFGDARAEELMESVGAQTGSIGSALEFFLRSGMTRDEFAQVDDAITTSSEDFVRGLVNVNTAPRDVLACLPGVGEDFADELAAYRADKDLADLDSVAWVTEVLDDESAIEAGPYLTTRSYVFSADVVALGQHGRGFRRDLMIFDTAADETAVVYRRVLCRFGWPLGDRTYAELTESEDGGDFEL
jgi:type II secretory pathway component PulK